MYEAHILGYIYMCTYNKILYIGISAEVTLVPHKLFLFQNEAVTLLFASSQISYKFVESQIYIFDLDINISNVDDVKIYIYVNISKYFAKNSMNIVAECAKILLSWIFLKYKHICNFIYILLRR